MADRVVFLKAGRVRCVGSVPALKQEFSMDSRVSVIVRSPEDIETVTSEVSRQVAEVRVKLVLDRKIDFEVPRSDPELVLKMMRLLNSETGRLSGLIRDWGITSSSFDDVFFNLHK